ncbi:MAG: acyltransferase, partial [Pseudomonadales bacterium]|nr:acyltransferase [Pseudomonadales bacterium]
MLKLKGFDGVRAIACFMVIFHHVSQVYNPVYLSEFYQLLWGLLYAGEAGVSVFFVLSGALLAYPFFYSFTHNKPMPSIKKYLTRRFFRIAPAYYLALCVSAGFAVLLFDSNFNSDFIIRFIAGLTFTNAFSALTLFPTDINGPLWSIGFEFISYLFLIVFMYILFKFVKKQSISETLYLFAIGFFVVIICHLVYLRVIEVNQRGADWAFADLGGAKTWFPYYNVFSLFAHFFIGMLASLIMVMIQNKNQSAHKSFDWIIGLNTVLFLIYWTNNAYDTYGIFEIKYFWPVFPIYVASSLMLLPFTVLLADLLDNRFFKFTAKISFGLYLWHFLVMKI